MPSKTRRYYRSGSYERTTHTDLRPEAKPPTDDATLLRAFVLRVITENAGLERVGVKLQIVPTLAKPGPYESRKSNLVGDDKAIAYRAKHAGIIGAASEGAIDQAIDQLIDRRYVTIDGNGIIHLNF